MIEQAGKEHLIHRQFTLPKGYSVESFVIREIDGHDEKEAARMIAAIGTADDYSIAMMNANLRCSIVSVNGAAVAQPYMDFSNWSSKTRRLLLEAWNVLNNVPDEELATFLGVAQSESPKATQAEGEILADDLASAKID